MVVSSAVAHRACTVSFLSRGHRQEAKVDAETAYEAAVHALKQWSTNRHLSSPHRHTVLELEVATTKRLTLRVSDVLKWLYEKPGRTPEEEARKKRLRNLLAHDGH